MRHRKKSIVVEAFQLNERGAGDYIIRGVNGPFIDEQKDLSLRWRGSANQRVIDVQKTLESYAKYNEVTLLDGDA